MIPIRDTIQSKSYPVVNNIIIAANVLLYLVQLTQGDRLNHFFITYGLVPARYSVPQIAAYFTSGQQVLSFFSFMFIHGGFWHLLGQVPTIGASGAIAGVMGAYLLLFPRAKVLTLIPIFFIPYFINIPAYLFLGFWFLLQFISAAGSSGQAGGVAWWAHIGGFVFGMIFVKLFLKIPELGVTRQARRITSKKKTHRLQSINVIGTADDPHLYGSIIITPREAKLGTRKVVNIPWGFQKRLFHVTVPPGVSEGTKLRLADMEPRRSIFKDQDRGIIHGFNLSWNRRSMGRSGAKL
jgi:membrane associated rhomboid family serine protease